MKEQEINEDSNSVSLGFAPLEMRVSKPKPLEKKGSKNIDERIRELDHRLATSITIVSPIQLHNYTFRTELRNFRFEKKSKIIGFGSDVQGNEEREIQQLFATFKDVFYNWRAILSYKFFIAFGNGDLAYFLHKPQIEDPKKGTKKGGSFVIFSCKRSTFSQTLQDFKIPYQQLRRSDIESERLLIKNGAIQLYWKCLTSLLMEKPANFQIISNFYFMNALEVLPVEIYNGKQQRPEYEHLAHKKHNVLGQELSQLYSMRIEGFWMKENLANMCRKLEEMCESKPFEIEFDYHLGTEDFFEECERL